MQETKTEVNMSRFRAICSGLAAIGLLAAIGAGALGGAVANAATPTNTASSCVSCPIV